MFVVLGPSLSVFYPLRTLSSFSFSQANVLWHPSFTVEQCAFYLQHNALRNSQLSGLFLFPSDLCPRSPHLPIISTYWYLRLWSPFCAFDVIPPESWTFTALDAFTQIAFPLPIPNDLNHLRVKTGKTIHVTPHILTLLLHTVRSWCTQLASGSILLILPNLCPGIDATPFPSCRNLH